MLWNICKHYNLTATEKWYKHKPNTVTEYDECTILWDMSLHTDREIKANRPDIIVKDKEQKQCHLIDVTVPSERNVSAKEVEKLSKYKDLENEITRMWDMKTLTIPVVVGALGLMKKELDRHNSKIPGEIHIREMQKLCFLEQHTFQEKHCQSSEYCRFTIVTLGSGYELGDIGRSTHQHG